MTNPEAPKLVTSQGSAPRATSVQGHSLVPLLRLGIESTQVHGPQESTKCPGGLGDSREISAPPERNRGRKTLLAAPRPQGAAQGALSRGWLMKTRRDARWSLNPTQVCPPLNAAAQSTPEEACVSPRHRAGGLTLSAQVPMDSSCHTQACLIVKDSVWLRGAGCQFC